MNYSPRRPKQEQLDISFLAIAGAFNDKLLHNRTLRHFNQS